MTNPLATPTRTVARRTGLLVAGEQPVTEYTVDCEPEYESERT